MQDLEAFENLTLNDELDENNIDDVSCQCPEAPEGGEKMIQNNQAPLLKSIELIGYRGSLKSEKDLKVCLEEGPKNIEFTKLISFLTNELRTLCNIDECVNAITTPEDSVSFIMETSSFLTELGCPHTSLTQGHVSDRLCSLEERWLLIEYLITELCAARILAEDRPEKKMELKLQESSQAADLRKILQTLNYPKPPSNITMKTLMQKVCPSIQNRIQKAHADLLGNPIFKGTLSEKQWEKLADVQQELHEDYLIRREMLLKRLDCTIQSFQWSGRTKGSDNLFNKAYSDKRKLLKTEPDIDLSDLIASRDDLAVIEKTSSASVRKNTKSSVNDVIIGRVPDRGGRTSEQAPPPPEMPPWQQRSAGGGGGGGGGGGRGGYQGQFGGRGGSNYSRGGGMQSNYGSQQSSYGGNQQSNYGMSQQSSYGGGQQSSYGGNRPNSYSGGQQSNYSSYSSNSSFSQDNKGSNRGSFDSAGSYGRGDYTQSSSDYSRGGNDYSRSGNDYSRGSYSRDKDYSKGSGTYSQSYEKPTQKYDSYSQGSRGFDSAGSYGSHSQDYQEPKRVKTFDEFQHKKTSYADEYVQDSQHNKQFNSRDRENRSRGSYSGKSNYRRGGGGGGSYR